ncbi:MutS protein msh4 [Pyricularia oryzae]
MWSSSQSSGEADRILMPPPPLPSRRAKQTPYPKIQTPPSRGLTASPYFASSASQDHPSTYSPQEPLSKSNSPSRGQSSGISESQPMIHRSDARPPTRGTYLSNRPGTATTSTSQRPGTYARSISRAPTAFAGCEGRQIICAVSEGRGVPPVVGLAIIDIDIGSAVMSQICDTQCYVHTIHKIRVHEPKEILIVSSAGPPNRKSVLYSIIEEELSDVPITTLDRKYWSEITGLAYIESLAFHEDVNALKVSVNGNFYAICALSAALRHLELQASVRIAPHSLAMSYEPPDDSMMIDVASIHALELLQNSQNIKSKQCLFGLLNNTLTPMGARYLRSCILQPSTKKEIIAPRHEAVEELSSKEDMFFEVRKGKSSPPLFRTPNFVLTLPCVALKALPDIDRVVSKAYKEQTDNLYEYDDNRKFWLRFSLKDFDDTGIPSHLINTVRNKGYLECQTIQLNQLNSRISDASCEVLIQSEKVVESLVKELRTQIPHLTRLCQAIGYLDMLASFAYLVTISDYCRPDMTSTVAMTSARHPIVEQCVANFVPNHYYVSDQYSFQIITGCNMSGKSTYIKTLAVLQVMAQIGSFVPAEYASLPIVHKIFTRISKDDSIESNLSTFSLEMREMAFILRNIDSRSLAIIDELGRGTSTRDGLAIAIAISEALIESGAQVLFATHFHELATVLNDRPHVVNQHLQAETSVVGDGPDAKPKITMIHKIAKGPLKDDSYGLDLARVIGFPPSFIENAQNLAERLRRNAAAKKQSSDQHRLMRRRALVTNLRELLIQARDSHMDDSALLTLLKRLQVDFVNRMAEIDDKDTNGDEQHTSEHYSTVGSTARQFISSRESSHRPATSPDAEADHENQADTAADNNHKPHWLNESTGSSSRPGCSDLEDSRFRPHVASSPAAKFHRRKQSRKRRANSPGNGRDRKVQIKLEKMADIQKTTSEADTRSKDEHNNSGQTPIEISDGSSSD